VTWNWLLGLDNSSDALTSPNFRKLEEAHLSVTKMPRFKEFRFVRRLVHLERLPAGPLLGQAKHSVMPAVGPVRIPRLSVLSPLRDFFDPDRSVRRACVSMWAQAFRDCVIRQMR
jgi:hypothetical protein